MIKMFLRKYIMGYNNLGQKYSKLESSFDVKF